MNTDAIFIGGIHPVQTVLHRFKERMISLWIVHESLPRFDALIKEARAHQIRVETVTIDQMDRQFEDFPHQGIAAQCYPQKPQQEGAFLESIESAIANTSSFRLLALDGVQDPRNLGACLRSAAVFGAHAVIVPKDRSADLTPSARKASCGGSELVPLIRVTNLSRTLNALKEKGVWVIGFAEAAPTPLHTYSFPKSCCLVLGNEGQGLRRLTSENCDELITIAAGGSLQSLNVSVACGVALYASTARTP